MASVKAQGLLDGLGGSGNVVLVEACITRLRVDVRDPHRVDEAQLKDAGAFGVVRTGRIIQVIVGPEADDLAVAVHQLLGA